MIKSFKHKGLEKYFYNDDRSRIDPKHSSKLARILDRLDASLRPQDMNSRRKPTHPGEILREDIIKPHDLTVTEAAKRLGVTRKTLSALINCKASMSPEMAVRVARATKTSPESWLYMQAKLDLWLAQQNPPKVQQLGNIALSS